MPLAALSLWPAGGSRVLKRGTIPRDRRCPTQVPAALRRAEVKEHLRVNFAETEQAIGVRGNGRRGRTEVLIAAATQRDAAVAGETERERWG